MVCLGLVISIECVLIFNIIQWGKKLLNYANENTIIIVMRTKTRSHLFVFPSFIFIIQAHEFQIKSLNGVTWQKAFTKIISHSVSCRTNKHQPTIIHYIVTVNSILYSNQRKKNGNRTIHGTSHQSQRQRINIKRQKEYNVLRSHFVQKIPVSLKIPIILRWMFSNIENTIQRRKPKRIRHRKKNKRVLNTYTRKIYGRTRAHIVKKMNRSWVSDASMRVFLIRVSVTLQVLFLLASSGLRR